MIVLTIGASGCVSTVSDYCLIAKPHRFTDKTIDAMTDAEVEQELIHNEQYAKLCGDKDSH